MVFDSILPSVIKARLSNKTRFGAARVLSMRLCLHLVHSECICARGDDYSCPVDRGRRMALMPMWTGGYAAPPDAILVLMRVFYDYFFAGDAPSPNGSVASLASLAGGVMLLEARPRAAPDAMRDVRTLTLINQLFFTFYHRAPALDGERRLGALQKLLMSLLTHVGFDPAGFAHRVRTIAGKMMSDERKLVFLRKAAILEFIVQGDFKGGNLELSQEILAEKFGVQIHSGVKLREFRLGGFPTPECPAGTELPGSFFGFGRRPYLVDFSVSENLAICLITGDILTNLNDAIRSATAEEGGRLTFRPVLILRGDRASETFIYSFAWRTRVEFGPIYLDGFGDPDLGFRHGSMLRLSEAAVAREVDRLLSHAWTDSIV
jgi:hypothetical protein